LVELPFLLENDFFNDPITGLARLLDDGLWRVENEWHMGNLY